MAAHPHAGHPHGDLHNVDVHHETSDISVRGVIWFASVLAAVVLAINVAMWGMFRVLDHFERKYEPAVSPLTRAAAQPQDFPAPSLQTTPWTDLKAFHAAQESDLHGYGWVDETLGVARIPIEKAKEMLLQRGIPVRPELADDTAGTHLAATGESNGGRTIPAGGADKSGLPSAAPAPAAAPQAPKAGGGN
jgi:hypothetical protein